VRPIIIAIAGASGSGKTTLSKYLQRTYGIPAIVSTTTRPRRKGEVEGEDYFFVSSTRGIGREAMLTYTRFGKYEYFSLKSQLPASGYCTYVVDENGIKALKQSSGREYDVFTVYVSCRAENLPARGVDAQRIERDSLRRQVDYSLIDVVLGNNGTEAEFREGADRVLKILEQWQHLR
jgi:guanylate kinase